jgi:hypothetical protein
VAVGQRDSLGSRADVKLSEEVPHMELDRVLADAKRCGNCPVPLPGGQVLEHLEFPWGQIPSCDIPGRVCRRIQGEGDADVRTRALDLP